jgi:hypothetical protein
VCPLPATRYTIQDLALPVTTPWRPWTAKEEVNSIFKIVYSTTHMIYWRFTSKLAHDFTGYTRRSEDMFSSMPVGLHFYLLEGLAIWFHPSSLREPWQCWAISSKECSHLTSNSSDPWQVLRHLKELIEVFLPFFLLNFGLIFTRTQQLSEVHVPVSGHGFL